jgi:uncharacterized protein (UPF0332 family)
VTPEQQDLLLQARDSLAAARLLHAEGYYGFAAARAYFAMFHVAQALLLGRGLSFSRHSGVIAAFGQHLGKTGIVPLHFHRYLIRGIEVRHSADYGGSAQVTPEESSEQLSRAEEFMRLGDQQLGPLPGGV